MRTFVKLVTHVTSEDEELEEKLRYTKDSLIYDSSRITFKETVLWYRECCRPQIVTGK